MKYILRFFLNENTNLIAEYSFDNPVFVPRRKDEVYIYNKTYVVKSIWTEYTDIFITNQQMFDIIVKEAKYD